MSNFDYETKGYIAEWWFDGQCNSDYFDTAEEAVEFARKEKKYCKKIRIIEDRYLVNWEDIE